MSRLQLFLVRLAMSAAVLLPVFAIVRGLWYPGAYFAISGVGWQFLVLVVAAVIIGPGLSAFVYKPGKRSLVSDLSTLAVVEVVAIVAAVSVLYLRQPYYTVFAVDRFEAVSRHDVDRSAIVDPEMRLRPGHTPRLVYAQLPDDPEALSRLVEETVMQGQPDIDRNPDYWRPYWNGVAAVREAAKPIADLQAGAEARAARVRTWLEKSGYDDGDLSYLPLRGKAGDAMLILHADTGYPVATLNVDPW